MKVTNWIQIQRWQFIFYCLILICGVVSCGRNNLPEGAVFYEPPKPLISVDWASDSQRLVGASPVKSNGISFADRESSEIYIWDLYTDTFTQVSDMKFTTWNADPKWNPQADQILYYSQQEFDAAYKIGLVDITSKEKKGIITFGDFPDWLPNGQEFIIGNLNELFIVNKDSGDFKTIWMLPIDKQIKSLSVSPNGNYIAIVIKTLEDPHGSAELWIFNVNNQLTEKILELSVIENVEWSSDGKWLTFLHNDGYGEVTAISKDGSCITTALPIDEQIVDFSWSPDGNSIAAVVYEKETQGIILFDVESKVIQNWLSSGDC